MTEPASVQTWTIRRVLEWAAEDFKARGIESARLDAELLLGHVLEIDRVELIVQASRPLHPEELGRFREMIRRRRGAEPIAYILGEREFYGLPFKVDPRVLVPRPDTETLVDVALDRTRSRSMFGRALDLCTGSGCVAIAFWKKRPSWVVTGADISEDALEVARDNAHRLGVVPGVRFSCGDLSAAVEQDDRFDLITANPPYIPQADVATLSADIRDHEPRVALEGGADGLSIIRRIVESAIDHLEPSGVLAIEVGHGQATSVAEAMRGEGLVEVETRRDYGGVERVVSAAAPKRGRGQGPP